MISGLDRVGQTDRLHNLSIRCSHLRAGSSRVQNRTNQDHCSEHQPPPDEPRPPGSSATDVSNTLKSSIKQVSWPRVQLAGLAREMTLMV